MPFASSCSRAQQGILAATLVWLLLVPETDLAFAIAFGCGVASGWLIDTKHLYLDSVLPDTSN